MKNELTANLSEESRAMAEAIARGTAELGKPILNQNIKDIFDQFNTFEVEFWAGIGVLCWTAYIGMANVQEKHTGESFEEIDQFADAVAAMIKAISRSEKGINPSGTGTA